MGGDGECHDVVSSRCRGGYHLRAAQAPVPWKKNDLEVAMISCSIRTNGRIAVTFSDAAPARIGQRVGVAGDFNGWDPTATPMRWGPGGHMATVELEAERHRFRYWSSRDGWFNDDSASSYEFNEFGQKNCVLNLAVPHAGLRRSAAVFEPA
ncbi:MAG TPA: isoamylase early set domain-containing protein [Sporichthyaceae bacterium]|nr:isoamylase early set domain-containing protein [Sporichthyaceae bacterium]